MRLLLLLCLWWLWGPLSALAQGAPAGTARAEDVVDLEFSTERPLHLVSPSFLSVTIDANLATDPRFLTFLGLWTSRVTLGFQSEATLGFSVQTLTGPMSEGLVGILGSFSEQSQIGEGGGLGYEWGKGPTLQVPSGEFGVWLHWMWAKAEVGISWVSQDGYVCRSEPVSPDVMRRLQEEWPFLELLLLKEQYQREFKNSTYSRSSVDMLYSFAKCSGLDLIFGLNALLRTPDLRWNSSNAQLLLEYCASKGYNISWELGNEPNSFWKKAHIFIDGLQLGEDFVQFRKLLRKSAFKNAKLYGPDVGQPRGKTVKLLRSYYLNGRIATKEDFLSSDVLDTFISSVQKVLKVTKEMRPGKKVWLGETSSAYGGGAPSLSNTFAAGFMWLDKLGISAQMGIEVVMRQVFFGAGNYHLVDENFEPLPDYWLSLLFKKLVGPQVLMVRVKGLDRSKLRMYLHCTNTHHPKYQDGDLTLYVLNLHNVTKHVNLPYQLFNKPVDKYLLKPFGPEGLLSKSVQLNGETLKIVDDHTLPALTEKPLRPGSSLGMPAFSYGFFVIRNAKIAACL
ncbi:heparanase [Cricetulus griseus]|uniref:Heparanase n=1 Tax=Cricetulus griseus TaxID=10029 RepID=A0A061IHB1_CRIGR|nr:heparanase [Cricetulus griseus]